MVRGRRMKKNSDAKKAIAQNRAFIRDPPPPPPPPVAMSRRLTVRWYLLTYRQNRHTMLLSRDMT